MVASLLYPTKSGPNRDVSRTASQIAPIASEAHRSRSSTKTDLLMRDEGSCGIVVMSPPFVRSSITAAELRVIGKSTDGGSSQTTDTSKRERAGCGQLPRAGPPAQTISIRGVGVATSSASVRRWESGVHQIEGAQGRSATASRRRGLARYAVGCA